MKRIRFLPIGLLTSVAAIASMQAMLLSEPLQLPPGMEQTLPIHPENSYYGDAIRAVDCRDSAEAELGVCRNIQFGGFLLFDSAIHGQVRIRFSPPHDGVADFTVTHPGGLFGEEGDLVGPQLYRFPLRENVLSDPDGLISSGRLNLHTGEVTDLQVHLTFANTGLEAVGRANPDLQRPAVSFPGRYGSAVASFSQREDGLLDFTFEGSTFLPVAQAPGGEEFRFPLPFCGPQLDCATVQARGTALHPHLRISTQAPAPAAAGRPIELPENSTLEFTIFSANTMAGDAFDLAIPELGGPAIGGSLLTGRLQMQLGERFGNYMPFRLALFPPKALLAEPPEAPISVPGLNLGLLGHDVSLQFPNQTYHVRGVVLSSDHFDVPRGVVDLRTGKVLGDLLIRGFLGQNVLFKVLELNEGEIEPSSFLFRGPAALERTATGQTVFRFAGAAQIDFGGFVFPTPDLQSGWTAGPDARLDPFLTIQAMHGPGAGGAVMSGSGSGISADGSEFTYLYSIPCNPAGRASQFEYTNHEPARGGTFRMDAMASVTCLNSRNAVPAVGQFDTVSFTAYGTWRGEPTRHLATVQISTAPEEPYVSILIDGGLTSNVDTGRLPEQVQP